MPLSKPASLAVVICFGAAFVLVMVLLDKQLDTMLVGFSAYAAVLVTYEVPSLSFVVGLNGGWFVCAWGGDGWIGI